jgi:hypothetical protein
MLTWHECAFAQVMSGSGDASRPGARFAQLKAAEAAKGKGAARQKRQAQGGAPNVNWADSAEEKDAK